ncbi:hypothetical protein O1611_g10501 [Lasiodiplodia mahajangana]|uniref:Uncharacterized protein n=1 Tax=Lasiodiplodia mahajangana TaxID=1108764 RepID=A0ACC2IXG0_9PEZI|nr:hypothetical protein O1611_g10501 [Lasiodiplodia mahajangana]
MDGSSADPSHGGQYNVLSSGTPSGINLEQAQSTKQHDREEGQFLKLSHSPPASPKNLAAASTAKGLHTQREKELKSQAAAMPTPMTGENKETTTKEPEHGKTNDHAGAAALGAGAMGVGAMGAGKLMTGSHSSGPKVTHRCTKCGEENDISEYVMI